MRRLELTEMHVPGAGGWSGCGLLCILILLPGLQWTPFALPSTIGPFPFWLVGLVCWIPLMVGGFWHIKASYNRFDNPTAFLAEEVVRRGDEFHFSFRMNCRARTRFKSVGVFFVFSEKVTIRRRYANSDSPTPNDIYRYDRLIDGEVTGPQVYETGQSVSIDHSFRVPERPLGIKNPYQERYGYSMEPSWIIKVRLELDQNMVEWRDYRLILEPGPLQTEPQFIPKPDPEPLFDIFFVGHQPNSFWSLQRAWQKYLPHGISGSDCDPHGYGLLLERRTRTEAQVVKARLEEAGAIIEIRPTV